MFFLESFRQKYDVVINEVAINQQTFQFFLPNSIDPFINDDNPIQSFPLWAKIWKSSLTLADFIAREPAVPEKYFLEIGAGIGLVGIAAAAFGHQVTISEYNPDALAFIRANACINHLPDLKVNCLDWNIPEHINGQYDCIIGSEIIYKKEDLDSIQLILNKLLKPDGEIIIASEFRKVVFEFFAIMSKTYHVEVRRMKISSDDGALPVLIFRIKPKNTF
jgi:predicted nicotinamide N-methyase